MVDRKYASTHPWISFHLDLSKASFGFWMKLGEAQSKCDHIAGVPLPRNVGERLRELYLAKGVLATTAIEGNTLTETQVLEQLEGKLSLPPSKEYLRQEVQNIIDACTEIATKMRNGEQLVLDKQLILHFNSLVLKGLELDKDVGPGKLREHSVLVGKYRGAPVEDCDYLLEQMCRWLNEFNSDAIPQLALGLLKAILAHLYIAWIHPFGDGNGRTARLIEFYILSGAGMPAPAAHLLSNHYNETRSLYYRKLDEARSNPLSFLDYALEGFVDGLKEQLKIIRDFQWDLTWRDHVIGSHG